MGDHFNEDEIVQETKYMEIINISWLKRQMINSVAFSSRANYTNWATGICWRNLVQTFADKGVLRGQRGRSPRSLISVF
jgi:hypothetical protein